MAYTQADIDAFDAETDSMAAVAEAMQALVQAMSKPKTLVRGPDGRAIGVQ